jgi:fatty acid desaturase
MNKYKKHLLDQFVSPKILAGPHATVAGREAARRLDSDPRYALLKDRLSAAGFFAPARAHYVIRTLVLVALGGGAYGTLLATTAWLPRIIAAAVVGFVAVQGCFLGHEAAHGAITRRSWLANAIGHAFGTFYVGYSYSYFHRSHDLHHYHCNEESHDPDTHSELFSVFASSVEGKRGIGRALTAKQHVLIPLMLPGWAIAMRLDGMIYVASGIRRRWLDAVLIVLHHVMWLVVPIVIVGPAAAVTNLLLWFAFAGTYLGLIIPVNHVGMPSVPPGADPAFLEQQVQTSRNLPSSWLHDLVFIGLNSQIEHHLFPYVPAIRLRRGRAITHAMCRDLGLTYSEIGIARAYRDVLAHFARVARGDTAQPRLATPEPERGRAA